MTRPPSPTAGRTTEPRLSDDEVERLNKIAEFIESHANESAALLSDASLLEDIACRFGESA